MTVIDELLCGVSQGLKYDVNFKQRSIRVGKRYLIKNGISEMEFGVGEFTTDEVLERLEELYASYKTSIPSERSENKRRKYFVAKHVNDLSVNEMCFGEQREIAQAELESWLLLNFLKGNYVWQDETKWFWQGTDKDLIILKEWFYE